MVAVTTSISPEWPPLGGLPKSYLITDHFSLVPLLLGTLTRHKSASTLPCLLHSTAVKSCLCGVSASPPAEPSAAAPFGTPSSHLWPESCSAFQSPSPDRVAIQSFLSKASLCSQPPLPASTDMSELFGRHYSQIYRFFPDIVRSFVSLPLYTTFAQVQLNSSLLLRIPCSVPPTGHPFSQTPSALFKISWWPMVRTLLSLLRVWVQSLVRELKSHKCHGAVKK